MKLLKFIDEMAVEAGQNFLEAQGMFEKAVRNIKIYNLWNQPVVWRGFGVSRSNSWIVKVTTDREGWRGGWSEPVKKVMELLNLESGPIFVSKDLRQAEFFGRPRIFIPEDDFFVRYNPEFGDIASINKATIHHAGRGVEEKGGQDPVEVAKGYKKFKNSFPDTSRWQEMILTTKYYYLAYPDQMLQLSKKSKFSKIKDKREIKEYSDVVQIYNEWVSYLKWYAKKMVKDNPLVMKYYLEHYPREWFEA